MDCVNSGIDCPQFTGVANFATRLLSALRGADQLEPGLLLNVNYPNIRDGETVSGPVLNVLGTYALFPGFTGAVGADGGTYTVASVDPRPETLRGAD